MHVLLHTGLQTVHWSCLESEYWRHMQWTVLKRRAALLNFVLSKTFNGPSSLNRGSDGESGDASNIICAAYFCNLWILSRWVLDTFLQIDCLWSVILILLFQMPNTDCSLYWQQRPRKETKNKSSNQRKRKCSCGVWSCTHILNGNMKLYSIMKLNSILFLCPPQRS